MKAWNVKPGMLIRVGTIYGSDFREVLDVEKVWSRFTGEWCWRVTFKEYGRTDSVLRWRKDNCEVRKAA